MERIEKTVFISYRRTNFPWALSIFQHLTQHGYDVFFDFTGLASGDFERVIVESIKARAHFLVLLTPSALERCREPGDWLRREIETALATRRNIVPLMLEGFDFGTAAIASQLTGSLEPLRHYNALPVPMAYFGEAMQRLREKYLSVPLDAVLHPASSFVQQSTKEQQAAAAGAPMVRQQELTAQEWFERGVKAERAKDEVEAVRWYRKAADAGNALAARTMKSLTLRSSDRELQPAVAAIQPHLEHLQEKEANTGNLKRLWQKIRARDISNPSLAVIAVVLVFSAPFVCRGVVSALKVHSAVMNGKEYFQAKQYHQALPFFRKAAEAGSAEAAKYIRDIYALQDDIQAVTWFRQAAEHQNSDGAGSLGWMYENGRGGLPKDEAQAVSWYRTAAELSDSDANIRAFRETLPLAYILREAQAGNAVSMFNLGSRYENGRGGLPKDEAQAVAWYRKAAEAGDAYAMVDLGRMYENGRGGLPKDEAQAVNWYRKATADGTLLGGGAYGAVSIGRIYENGRGGLPKDEAQAVAWYRKAAELGDSSGMVSLGWMYEKGLVVQTDGIQAVKRHHTTAEEGSSMFNLGFKYENGRGGLPKSEDQAVSWYRRAAETDNHNAELALKRLGR